jgi:subtilisin family serine protease
MSTSASIRARRRPALPAFLERRRAAVGGGLALALTLVAAPAQAWLHDRDANRIDDRIERAQTIGFRAAFLNDDPTQKQRFAVNDGEVLTYPVYVGYDHIPTAADAAAVAAAGLPWVRPYLYIPYLRTEASFARIQAIARLPGVRRIEAVPVLYPANHVGSRVVRARDSRGYVRAQNDVLFPSARAELGLDGTGIVIAIFDTGVNDAPDAATSYPGHESLRGKFVGGGEFFYGNPALNTPNAGSMNPQDHGAAASQYHATHVAGTAMGTGGPTGALAGVAPKARLVDCKVLSDAGASVGGVVEAVEWAVFNKNTAWAGLSGADLIYSGIDVINMSLGGIEDSDGSEADPQAVNAAVRNGLVVCAASGNLGLTDYIAPPASADSSICVGATGHSKSLDRSDDKVTSFSQEGVRNDDGDGDHLDEMKPNVVAPGFGIVSADGDPSTDGTLYKALSGTSMASPHVAGCAALLVQLDPALTQLQLRAILMHTAEHNIPSEKGDRPNDPYGVDANYDPGCGWGLVDVYAAAKEVLDSAAGVQVTQMRKPVARVADGAIDLGWITQREYAFLGFEVHRAPDAGGIPGAFTRINPAMLVPPSAAGDPVLQADDNRTPYAYTDSDPTLTVGNTYWYRVAWVDLLGGVHPEPAIRAEYGALARVATAYYTIIHDYPDGDLNIHVGTSSTYDPLAPDFVTIGPGVAQEDSFQIAEIDFIYVPPGHIRHFWSIGFTTDDGVTPYLPPGPLHPWFLDVAEGGFADQFGRIEAFSMFVNDSPGSSTGTTYVTDSPTPRPTVETTRATLWIPEPGTTPVRVARLAAVGEPGGVRVTLVLGAPSAGATAQVLRSRAEEFAGAEVLTGSLALGDARFEYLDASAEPGVTYRYWVVLEEPDGGAIVSGPVTAMLAPARSISMLARVVPNPMPRGGTFHYAVGTDAAAGGFAEVSLALYDLQGRLVRELARGRSAAGDYHAAWDGKDAGGAPVAAGIYLVRFRAGPVAGTRRVSVIR